MTETVLQEETGSKQIRAGGDCGEDGLVLSVPMHLREAMTVMRTHAAGVPDDLTLIPVAVHLCRQPHQHHQHRQGRPHLLCPLHLQRLQGHRLRRVRITGPDLRHPPNRGATTTAGHHVVRGSGGLLSPRCQRMMDMGMPQHPRGPAVRAVGPQARLPAPLTEGGNNGIRRHRLQPIPLVGPHAIMMIERLHRHDHRGRHLHLPPARQPGAMVLGMQIPHYRLHHLLRHRRQARDNRRRVGVVER